MTIGATTATIHPLVPANFLDEIWDLSSFVVIHCCPLLHARSIQEQQIEDSKVIKTIRNDAR